MKSIRDLKKKFILTSAYQFPYYQIGALDISPGVRFMNFGWETHLWDNGNVSKLPLLLLILDQSLLYQRDTQV